MINNLWLRKVALATLFLLAMPGCSSLKYMVAKTTKISVPQITAYLKPAIKNNQITISGKIVMQNLEESDLRLGPVSIDIKDEGNALLQTMIFAWGQYDLKAQKEVESDLDIVLPLAMLDRKEVAFFLTTEVTYKDLGVTFPIKSKLVVLDMAMFKEAIIRPLDVAVYTKIYTNISAEATADFIFDITNPTQAGLVLRKGMIKIYTKEKGDIVKMALPETLFLPGEKKQIKDKMKLGNIFGTIMTNKLLSVYPLRLKISGEMNIPHTDISMPFSIETVQELDFSLLPGKKNRR